MDTKQAIQILINAVQLATTKGAYTLPEAKIIASAVEVFTQPQAEPKTEPIKEKKK